MSGHCCRFSVAIALDIRECNDTVLSVACIDLLFKAPNIKEVDELNDLYRENNRLSEEEYKILNEEPSDVTRNLGILKALRTASEDGPARVNQPPKSRTHKRSGKPELDAAGESPGPSVSVIIPSARAKGTSSVRSGSVPLLKDTKDPPVKAEEGVEGLPGSLGDRMTKLIKGAEVAYKQAKAREDGSQWIQCTIIDISEVKNKKQ